MPEVNERLSTLIDMGIAFAPKLVLAIITLIIGLWFVKRINLMVHKAFEAKDYDPALETFLASLISIVLKAVVVLAVIDMVGVEATSFIALLGAAGLAIGMALSGTLQNFAGGVMILIFKPFKIGDVIEAQGFTGKVNAIHIFNTILKTPDNKTIIIPNAPLSSNAMINYSTEATRRVDFTFGISYDDDIESAKRLLLGLITSDQRILNTPEPLVAVAELADSSINFTVRVWVKAEDFWKVYFDTNEKVKQSFDANGISIPFPQREVRMHQVT